MSRGLTSKYFPHYYSRGRRMNFLRKKYGNDAYVFWYMLLEELLEKESHVIDLRFDVKLTFLEKFAEDIEVDLEKLNEMLCDLAELEGISSELWNEHRIIYSQEFVDSLTEYYRKSKKTPPTLDMIYDVRIRGFDVKPAPINNTKEIKLNKLSRVPLPFLDSDFELKWKKWIEFKRAEFKFTFKSEQSYSAALSHLAKLSGDKSDIASAIIQRSIDKGWKGFFELPLNEYHIYGIERTNEQQTSGGKAGVTSFNPNDLSRMHEFANQNDERERAGEGLSGS